MTIYSGNKVGIFPSDYKKVFLKIPIPRMNKMILGQKPPMKGGHTHNHKENAASRKRYRGKQKRHDWKEWWDKYAIPLELE